MPIFFLSCASARKCVSGVQMTMMMVSCMCASLRKHMHTRACTRKKTTKTIESIEKERCVTSKIFLRKATQNLFHLSSSFSFLHLKCVRAVDDSAHLFSINARKIGRVSPLLRYCTQNIRMLDALVPRFLILHIWTRKCSQCMCLCLPKYR